MIECSSAHENPDAPKQYRGFFPHESINSIRVMATAYNVSLKILATPGENLTIETAHYISKRVKKVKKESRPVQEGFAYVELELSPDRQKAFWQDVVTYSKIIK